MSILSKAASIEEVRAYNPLVLAYIGDVYYELLVRRMLLVDSDNNGVSGNTGKLTALAMTEVCATKQAQVADLVHALLNEQEQDIYRRGKNAKSKVPKSASPQEYHKATGLEAVFGYWQLIGETDRAEEIFIKACYTKPNV